MRSRFNYNQASLPGKISLPYILMFLFFWVSGVVLIGTHFSRQLDGDQKEKATEVTSLVKRELDRELSNLSRSARLLANDEPIIQGTSQSDKTSLLRRILPRKAILETDVVMLFDREQEVLTNTRTIAFRDFGIHTEDLLDRLLSGSDISVVANSDNNQPPVMLGAAPIKDESGIVGGVILGTVLSSDLLLQINDSIDGHLMVLSNHQVVSSTFSDESDLSDFHWEDSEDDRFRLLELEGERYLAQAISLEGIGDNHFEVVLLVSQAQLTNWSLDKYC